MGKKSTKTTPCSTIEMPKAPWLYINDPISAHVERLHNGFDSSGLVHHFPDTTAEHSLTDRLLVTFGSTTDIVIVTDDYSDASENLTKKLETANAVRDAAIQHGCNFVSVNIYKNEGMGTKTDDLIKWGTNHLEIRAPDGDDAKSVQETTMKIYQWLLTVLTPYESLHVVSNREMSKRDEKNFSDYAYCSIAQSKFAPKDAKIQFVAIVLTQPVAGPDQKITWTVADKSGVANFYFQYRGPNSQYTWDWVLALKPGDRRALPRMPMVEIKERKRVKVAKAPFRAIGLAITGVGAGVRAIGHGVTTLGEKAKMGSSSKWVPEADVVNGKVVNWSKRLEEERKARGGEAKLYGLRVERGFLKNSRAEAARQLASRTQIKAFKEKGETLATSEKVWKDNDSVVSTENGSGELVNEKEFL